MQTGIMLCGQAFLSCFAGLEADGRLLHLRDVINLLRKADEPQKVVQALRAVNPLLAAAPDELSNYAGAVLTQPFTGSGCAAGAWLLKVAHLIPSVLGTQVCCKPQPAQAAPHLLHVSQLSQQSFACSPRPRLRCVQVSWHVLCCTHGPPSGQAKRPRARATSPSPSASGVN